MVIKNFVFRENWVLSEVAGILTQPEPTFWFQKAQIWNSLNRILMFNPLERQKLYYYQVCDLKTDLLK